MKSELVTVRCKCGLTAQIPAGGKRLCACGKWLTAEAVVDAPELEPIEAPAEGKAASGAGNWPRIEGDLSAIERLNDGYRRILRELNKVIVGQQQVIEELLIAIFARGHCLLVGVPGLAKTLMIRTLAEALNLSFSRIQFTPDLMPSDITGTEVLQEDKTTGQRVFKFLHGPIFANVILADEINRTPPKTQAALLEAMQENQVTVGGNRHRLPEPFFVLATQNPIEQEGTYPLPEAQQDRFMFNVLVDYPEEEEEYKIVEMTTAMHVAEGGAGAVGERHPGDAGHRAQGAGGAVRHPLRDEVRPADAQGEGRRAGLHPRVRDLGGGAAGDAEPGARRQGAGGAARPLLRLLRGHPGRGDPGAAASHHHQLQRRGRGDQAGGRSFAGSPR